MIKRVLISIPMTIQKGERLWICENNREINSDIPVKSLIETCRSYSNQLGALTYIDARPNTFSMGLLGSTTRD